MYDAHSREAAVFDAALQLPLEQRDAYLKRATDGDAALRQRVVSLLRAYDSGEFLDQAPAQALHRTGPRIEKPGDKIGHYKLLQQIGEGGCGVVYMAEQEEPVRRRVALKVIKLGMDTKSVIARFEAERQALAMMDHPNIAKVLEAGATGTGRPYFVMELVRGVKITEFCDEQKLSTGERLHLFIQVCQAIQHAHQKGVIHRDIKPSNILVTVNDGVPVPKVIDFGIAKATGGQRLTDKTVFTAFEQFIGTPAYMSPEQAVLTSVDIDTRSDIYALGVLLYELLTGKTPFDGKELLAIGLDEMRRTICESEPLKPSTRVNTLASNELGTTAQHRGLDAPKLVSQLRGDLDWIVMKALEKDRARRYETANGLATDIQRHLDDEPVVARPPSSFYRFQKLVRRNKLAVAAMCVVILSLAVGLTMSATLLAQERAARVRAVAAEEQAKKQKGRADEQAAIANAVKDFLQNDLLKQADIGDQADRGFEQKPNLTVKEALERASQNIGQRFTNQPLVEAEIRQTIAGAFCGLGEPTVAVPHFERAIALYEQVLGSDEPLALASMSQLAKAYEQAGRGTEAVPLWEKTLKLQEAKLGSTHPDTLKTMTQVARVIRWGGRLTEATAMQEKALKRQRVKLGADHPDTLESMFWLALIYDRDGRKNESLALQEERLNLLEAKRGPHHPATVIAMVSVADAYEDAGRLPEATKLLEEVLTLLKPQLSAAYDSSHRRALNVMFMLAGAYQQAGRQPEAQRLRDDILTTALGNNPQSSDQLNFRASLFTRLGRWKEASADLARLLVINPDRTWEWLQVAAALVHVGELDRYREHCRKSIERLAQDAGPSANNVERDRAYCITRACLILPSSGANLETVSKMADRALTLQRVYAGTNDSFWLWCMSLKSLAEYRQDQFAGAVNWAEKTLAQRPSTWIEVEAHTLLAMARHQLKQNALARAALATGEQLAQKLPKAGSGGREWENLIITDRLLREARALIEGSSEPRVETK